MLGLASNRTRQTAERLQVHWSDYTRFAIALFALLNPVTKIPYILSVTAGDARAVTTMALSGTVTMAVTLLAMHVCGEAILLALGTSLASFQIGGGLIILLSGLSMLSSEPATPARKEPHTPDRLHYVRLGVSPLGIPMLTGAGAMTKVIIETHPEFGIEAEIELLVVILMVCLISGGVLAASSLLARVLGASFFSIFARIAGLVIVAVAVEVMARGVSAHAQVLIGD